MSHDTVFKKINTSRVKWQALYPNATESMSNPEYADFISKCLALRALELPVKEFILDGLDKKEAKVLGDEGRKTLLTNVKDEERHDTTLNNCVAVFKEYNADYEIDAAQILNEVFDNPDNPIVKAAVIENSIFFLILPFMRKEGALTTREAAKYISADEIRHVQSHRYAAQLMGLRPSSALNKIRKDIVNWLADSYPGDKNSLMEASNSLLKKGITDVLKFSQVYSTTAFFERPNETIAYYN